MAKVRYILLQPYDIYLFALMFCAVCASPPTYCETKVMIVFGNDGLWIVLIALRVRNGLRLRLMFQLLAYTAYTDNKMSQVFKTPRGNQLLMQSRTLPGKRKVHDWWQSPKYVLCILSKRMVLYTFNLVPVLNGNKFR